MTSNMLLDKLVTHKGSKGPLLLVVADGVGLAPAGPANAVSLAETPVLDRLIASRHSTRLHAHGPWVGLPGEDDMGNSEVGHNALGSGQIISQGAKLVNEAFASGGIFDSESWRQVESRGGAGACVHFIGLLSDGNVHSHIDHLLAMIRRCAESGIARVRVHCLLDGRDVDPRSAPVYVERLQETLGAAGDNGNLDYRIASGGGRMVITMDRYQADWDMVRRGYETHVLGEGRPVTDVIAEIRRQYESDSRISDQTLEPFVVTDDGDNPVGAVADGDAVVFFNFRGDRAIEFSQAMESNSFNAFERKRRPDAYFCGMLEYDGDLGVPSNYLVNPPVIEGTMVEYLCAEELKTFAVSETQKFGHVTYFWNGNRSGRIDEELETWVEIPSDRVPFNEVPGMKAEEITDETIRLMRSGEYRFGRINFANGDMVGHTGDIPATVAALEAVDRCLGRLEQAIGELEGIMILTADHGNADEMFIQKGDQRIPRTAHTLNPVPFVIVDPAVDRGYRLRDDIDGGLANVAATVFNLLGYRAPANYEPSLLAFPDEPRSRRPIHAGAVVNLGLETVKMPNGDILALEVVRHPGGVVVIAMDDERRICLIRQFRHPAGGWIWELPAGLTEGREEPLSTAHRELKEETGCTADDMIPLGSTLTTPGFCSERLHIYLAAGARPGEAEPEDYEFIETHWMTVAEALSMARDGTIDDAKTIVALFRLQGWLENRENG